MTPEEKEAANAALALDEMIEKRVWEIIEKERWKAADLVLQGLRDIYRNPEFSNIIAMALKGRP